MLYKEIRKELKMTQKEFSEKIGISQSVISDWENGSKEPSIETLRKIYELFGINVIIKILSKKNNLN